MEKYSIGKYFQCFKSHNTNIKFVYIIHNILFYNFIYRFQSLNNESVTDTMLIFLKNTI